MMLARCEDGKHLKVFSGEHHATVVPLYFWLCEVCGESGADRLPNPPVFDLERYIAIAEKIDWEHAAAMRRLLPVKMHTHALLKDPGNARVTVKECIPPYRFWTLEEYLPEQLGVIENLTMERNKLSKKLKAAERKLRYLQRRRDGS